MALFEHFQALVGDEENRLIDKSQNAKGLQKRSKLAYFRANHLLVNHTRVLSVGL
jgi:hypothetical protein